MAGNLQMEFSSPIVVNMSLTDSVRAEAAVIIASEFAEWLEGAGFRIDPDPDGPAPHDTRSYAELARDFVAQWKERA